MSTPDVTEINKKLDRIIILLVGNDMVEDDRGYIGKIDNMEQRLIAVEDGHKEIKWTKKMVLWVGGGVLSITIYLIKRFFNL